MGSPVDSCQSEDHRTDSYTERNRSVGSGNHAGGAGGAGGGWESLQPTRRGSRQLQMMIQRSTERSKVAVYTFSLVNYCRTPAKRGNEPEVRGQGF